MRISLEISPTDLHVIAEWLDAQQTGQCTSQQHDGITQSTLSRMIAQATLAGLDSTPAVKRVFARDYDNFGRATRRHGRLPKSKRTVI